MEQTAIHNVEEMIFNVDSNTVNVPVEEDRMSKQSKRPSKHDREEEEEENWITIGRNGKRLRIQRGTSLEESSQTKIEVFITSGSELPKQFAFARLMKNNSIFNILRIKYINMFKILVEFEDEQNLQNLMSCQEIKEKGWRIYRTSDVGTSYGIIRNIELDLKDEEILENITCDIGILAVKRLTRRSDDNLQWVPSESVRLCFRGSYLPPFVGVYGMRVKIDPYVYPVTQCGNCWKYGHTKKMCRRRKPTCPKCGKNHENCTTTCYVCVNCTGHHVALSKTCPTYIKERKIRSIMTEYNCTYNRALTMYIPDKTTPMMGNKEHVSIHTMQQVDHAVINQGARTVSSPRPSSSQLFTSYAVIAASSDTNKNAQEKLQQKSGPAKVKKKINKKGDKNTHNQKINDDYSFEWECCCTDSEDNIDKNKEENRAEPPKKRLNHSEAENSSSFEWFLTKLKDIFFSGNNSFFNKLVTAAKIGFKWLLSILSEHFCELPFLKQLFDQYGP